ncbi:MAG: sensor histidine kinase [Sedimentitalea sp.]|nr:sensor histidine kinase [Sedimentitalea sp.]
MSIAERTPVQQTGAIAMQGVDAAGDGASAQVRGAARRASRRALGLGVFPLKSSPLTRRIITFNLIALNVLVAGILLLNASRESLVMQHASALIGEAELIANVFEVQSAARGAESLTPFEVARALDGLSLRNGVEVYVFDAGGSLAGHTEGTNQSGALTALAPDRAGKTPILDGLGLVWTHGVRSVIPAGDADAPTLETQLRALIPATLRRGTQVETGLDTAGGTVFSASTPIRHGEAAIGVVAVATPSGEIDAMVRGERERVLQMFLVAALVSVGLSLVLASTIANPLADLAEAAETGRERNAGKIRPGRIRIPDLSGRPDEIGRLSRAMRGMVSALYNRIDANEQFAADVAHEIKNPLASLRSAVGTMRMVTREDQRNRLLGVIEHDVRRLDRLVSDISNASRLDAELVKEDEKEFDLLAMLATLNQYLGADAEARGIDYITDMPAGPILIQGLEARLAQVFVNLITNAISFSETGDAIRVWVRRRKDRVLVVIEDTGPGIPDEALAKIFRRFYSQRPEEHFGNNSGLGLAISKQIVEAHGGVIWAENIRPTEADILSDPLGARFVVGLPV